MAVALNCETQEDKKNRVRWFGQVDGSCPPLQLDLKDGGALRSVENSVCGTALRLTFSGSDSAGMSPWAGDLAPSPTVAWGSRREWALNLGWHLEVFGK